MKKRVLVGMTALLLSISLLMAQYGGQGKLGAPGSLDRR